MPCEGLSLVTSERKKVAFYTLGCKLNFSETSTIARDFVNRGFDRVNFDDGADVYVINTCSVTENADREFKRIVRRALGYNSDAFLIAIGCYAQLQPHKLVDIDGVDLVLGAREKFNILNYITDLTKSDKGDVYSCEVSEANFYVSSFSLGDRTRAFLKVQDGCDYKCSYCTIPMARGISRSDSLKNIIDNAKEISERGIKEIVLTGVNIGDYGKGEFGNKKHDHTFLDLLKSLDELEDVCRIRISSIEPNLLSEEIIEFIADSDLFVPHFHIPLQSGSDFILKKMRRRYLSHLYKDRIDFIKRLIPHACIGVDVIVGFPGETDECFLETFNFIKDLDVSYLHVFTYSERLNTDAANMSDAVPKSIRHKRSKLLRGLSAKKRRHFYQQYLHTKRTVLFESEDKGGYIYGFTDNYIRVKMPYDPQLENSLIDLYTDKIEDDGVVRVLSEILVL